MNTANDAISDLESSLSESELEIIRLLALLEDCGNITDAVNVQAASALSVYPNPTTGIVYLNDVNHVKVYNSNGALLEEKTDDYVDLSSYPSAMYLLQVGNEWVKILKQ